MHKEHSAWPPIAQGFSIEGQTVSIVALPTILACPNAPGIWEVSVLEGNRKFVPVLS
jgi:hypothetical protein